MRYKHIIILTGISMLLLALFAWQYSPADAYYNTEEGGSPVFISSGQVFLPLVLKNYVAPAPLWRFGAARVRNELTGYDPYGIVSMRFGWHVDFSVNTNVPTPYGIEYVPTVRLKQLKLAGDGSETTCCVDCAYVAPYKYIVSPSISQIQSTAASHPGMTWLIGNEMDATDKATSDGGCSRQDEMLPELYAQAYHDLYDAIKSADPTAQVAIGGMVEFTDLRSQYLDRIWAEYSRLYGQPMPVDIWNIHLYVLQEVKGSWGADIPPGFSETQGALYTLLDHKDFTKAWAQILAFRTWMKDHGQQNKPLIITEYGVLFPAWVECPGYPDTSGCPFTPEQVRDSIMYPSFNAFMNQTDLNIGYPADGYRLVQRWNWFSVDYDLGICDTDGEYIEYAGGSLFNSGLGPSNPPNNCSFPAQGITALGEYWKQYVQSLPVGSIKPYAP